MISFILNNKKIETAHHLPGMTLLDFIRYEQHLKGTKIGCREGDCGACTVLIGKLQNGSVNYISMTSCLTPLINVQGCHVVTIEGINGDGLTPVQEAVVDESGTQCGFCTVGFIMSLTGSCLHPENYSPEKIMAAMDGNICRCTGYKSLERAAHRISALLQVNNSEDRNEWLIKEGFLPGYFATIATQLKEIKSISSEGKGMVTGGGTDLYVQKHDSMTEEEIFPVFHLESLNSIKEEDDKIILGASVTVEDLKQSKLINSLFPDLQQQLKLVSSTPIRNMATLAGNFVNASPIGDMTIFFLALNTEIVLNNKGKKRSIHLKDFYKGYKILDKTSEELLEYIVFEKPSPGFHFHFEKVSKRTHLDIASVNTAISFTIKNNILQNVNASMGGVFAYPKYLTETGSFLNGKEINVANINLALEVLQTEISPISDVRGTREYKRLLARQLFIAHFEKFFSAEEVFNCTEKLNR
jgi:xanthine dehydrogenase small subunit